LQPLGEEVGLAHADRIELRVAVPVLGCERPVGVSGRRLAVADEQHRRRAGRRGEPVLTEPFRRDLGLVRG